MFAFGGLLVAIVIRFADNNLKNLAMALAILLSHLMLKEYSTKEIKKDFKPQFDHSPPWGRTGMM